MIDHDKVVGSLLALLDKMGVADDTFVQYSECLGLRLAGVLGLMAQSKAVLVPLPPKSCFNPHPQPRHPS
jgi:hypothetical protein